MHRVRETVSTLVGVGLALALWATIGLVIAHLTGMTFVTATFVAFTGCAVVGAVVRGLLGVR